VAFFRLRPRRRGVSRVATATSTPSSASPVKSKRPPQVAVFGEPDFGLAECPVLEAHQAEDRHQLRLREGVLRVLAAVWWLHLPITSSAVLAKITNPTSVHTITSAVIV
jgi:hypothetical protein